MAARAAMTRAALALVLGAAAAGAAPAPAAKSPAAPAVLETIVPATKMSIEAPPVAHVFAKEWPVVIEAKFTIDRRGFVRVDAINPAEVPTEMRTSSREAVGQWRFWPALGACRHLEQSGTANIVFTQKDVRIEQLEMRPLAPQRKLPAADFAWLDPAEPGDTRTRLRTYAPGFVETVPLKIVPPRYPTNASREALSGYAYVMLEVGTDGRVLQATATDAWSQDMAFAPQFGAEAVRAVKQWKFQPASQDGKPIRRWACHQMMFNMKFAKPR